MTVPSVYPLRGVFSEQGTQLSPTQLVVSIRQTNFLMPDCRSDKRGISILEMRKRAFLRNNLPDCKISRVKKDSFKSQNP